MNKSRVPPSIPTTPHEAVANHDPPDAILVARSQKGDLSAFDQLVTRYRNKVYGLIFHLVRNETEAWDLAQDTFIKAWRNLSSFRGEAQFYTWIYRIAHNAAYDWLRSAKNKPKTEFDDAIAPMAIDPAAHVVPHGATTPDRGAAAKDLGAQINDALAQLSPEHRQAMLLREVEGLSYEEIAESCSCSIGTVMSRLFYARKKLQVLLADVHESHLN